MAKEGGEHVRHVIESVERGSAAYRHGLRAGDALISLNGEAIVDEIDYQALIAGSRVHAVVERDGREVAVDIRKQEGEPLGLHFGPEMALSPRTCRNNCVFCFIRQMPPGLRKTLYVRDDDWRFSLMMGNFVTLTNVDDAEFERIIRRHASPLYVSVHATDPALRCRMMNNRFAGDILQRLTRLKDAGIRFHCQIVVCPGWNDGEQLLRTLSDLRALAPAAQTAAMVPVGLTRFREGLEQLRPFTKAEAEALLNAIAPFQEQCRRELGTTFAFPSDEFFCIAGRPIPPESWYEDFPQIENGVGLLRLFESDFREALAEREPLPARRALSMAGGEAVYPFFRELYRALVPYGIDLSVYPIRNDYFGGNVSVGGLVTGGDLVRQLTGRLSSGVLLIPHNMLREGEDVFLDGMTLLEAEEALSVRIRPVRSGADLVETVFSQP